MYIPTMFVSVVYVAFLVGVSGVPATHQHAAGGHEKYEVNLYIEQKVVKWDITNLTGDTGDIIKAIINYSELNATLPTHNIYRGYKIIHINNGAKEHTYVLRRCQHKSLEKSIIRYTTDQTTAVTNYRKVMSKTLQNACPKKSSTKL